MKMARFVPITVDMTGAVLTHLRESFFADEPLNAAVGLCERGQGHAALDRLCANTIRDGLSVAAVDGNEILGVALNGILKPGDVEKSIENIQQSGDEKYNKIFKILYSVTHELDLFTTYGVDRILECRVVSVAESARGCRYGHELMKRSVDVAKEHGFKLFKVDATGAYSHRIANNLGLTTLRRVPYATYCDEHGQIVFPVSPPHEALNIMVLQLP
ncbi:hypothetical protein JYU34_013784 [Plutella xylostella]|uniref:Dopamine N-acetyltransferase-like n=3 Tax=Plutella xylostella TaxID=51655 RepID=A0ABQ7QEA3_PLUXY|nr:hypothetical protein JYU34_013784 [Plutella xylostella]